MGGMAEMLRRRERRDTRRRPTWEILWLPGTFLAFCLAAKLFPRLPTPIGNALIWACFGIAAAVVITMTDRGLRRRARRRAAAPAAAGLAREQPLAWRWPAYLTVYVVAEQLRPLVPGTSPVAIVVVAGGAIVVAEGILALRWHRREAARRRNEVDRLAGEF